MASEKSDTIKNLMIIAGEVSGDLIGAALIKELRKLSPEIRIFGIGGDKMNLQGMNLIYHINRHRSSNRLSRV